MSEAASPGGALTAGDGLLLQKMLYSNTPRAPSLSCEHLGVVGAQGRGLDLLAGGLVRAAAGEANEADVLHAADQGAVGRGGGAGGLEDALRLGGGAGRDVARARGGRGAGRGAELAGDALDGDVLLVSLARAGVRVAVVASTRGRRGRRRSRRRRRARGRARLRVEAVVGERVGVVEAAALGLAGGLAQDEAAPMALGP